MSSNRQYVVTGFEYGTTLEDYEVTLDMLFNLEEDPTEIMITLAEQLDSHILDLKVGETAFVSLMRDHKQSKGVILRTV